MKDMVRDCREPEVLLSRSGRLVLIDQAVLDIIRQRVPADEPAPERVKIHSLEPLRFSYTGRPQAGRGRS